MRVIYKPWVIEHINKLIDRAYADDKKIEKIILTESEYDQLRDEMTRRYPGASLPPKRPTGPLTIYDVNVEVEEK